MKENVDNISEIWLPDPELCAQADELRREQEWLRIKSGYSGKRPSELGIKSYMWGSKLPEKFFEGRTPPPVPLDSLENIEWYEEQLKRCVYGFEYRGYRITGDHYWLLNFTPFLVAKKNKRGLITNEFDVNFPYFSYMHDYIFKLIEEAHWKNEAFIWMSGRGSGKTYSILSILAKTYHLKPKSHGIVSASNATHAEEAFNKLRLMLDSIAEVHPTLALARLQDTKGMIESGQEVVRDGVKYKEGPRSRIQRIVYGDNPGVTRGSRPDIQLLEEIGDWSSGIGDLKSCIGASVGSWRVGSIQKCRVFMIGTGGSVKSDQAKDIFTKPKSYHILPLTDFSEKQHGFFLPAHYLLGGKGWEETGVCNVDAAKEYLDEERERTRDDMEIHSKVTQEFPYTIEEVFRKMGTNNFNQRKIAEQWGKLQFEPEIRKPERGFLEWIKTPAGTIKGVKWSKNPEGDIEIVEHPYRGPEGNKVFKGLYVGGIDSIDQGQLDSTSTKNRSSLAMLVKKRIVDGQYFKQLSNIYVAKYIGRSLDVRWDYENALKLAMYYDCEVNIEYTKIGIVSYFRECKQYHRLMKRPMVSTTTSDDGSTVMFGVKKSNLIGTTADPKIIDHQDGKIKEYIDDYYQNILFEDLLEQLRDYQREDRTKFDLVVAMGLCELADEDLLGTPSREAGNETEGFQPFGWYTDERGYRHWGPIPTGTPTIYNETAPVNDSPVRWIDASGKPRFDDNYDVLLTDE